MLLTEYIKFIMDYNEILYKFPSEQDSLKAHYELVKTKIKTLDHFKICWFKHLESSCVFPTHMDLIKHTIKPLYYIDIDKLITYADEYHKRIMTLLKEKYLLSVPLHDSAEYKFSTNVMVHEWKTDIKIKLDKFRQEYQSGKITEQEVWTKEVIKEMEVKGHKF